MARPEKRVSSFTRLNDQPQRYRRQFTATVGLKALQLAILLIVKRDTNHVIVESSITIK